MNVWSSSPPIRENPNLTSPETALGCSADTRVRERRRFHMIRRRKTLLALAVVGACLVAGTASAGSSWVPLRPKAAPLVGQQDRVVLFSSDGMRPDLMETYAAQGLMPTYQSLMNIGVRGSNGMTPSFPPN